MDERLSNSPREVVDLYDLLTQAGFIVIEDRQGGMGGLSLIMKGEVAEVASAPSAEVHIAADRGRWTVALRFQGMSRFIDPRVWSAHLDGVPIGTLSLAHQVQFIATRLVESAQAVRHDPDLERKLVTLGEDYMRRRLGRCRGSTP